METGVAVYRGIRGSCSDHRYVANSGDFSEKATALFRRSSITDSLVNRILKALVTDTRKPI